TAEAVGYVRSFAGREFHAIHVRAHSTPADFGALWKQFSRTDVELDILAPGPHATTPVVDYIRALSRAEGDFVTVVIPELLRGRAAADRRHPGGVGGAPHPRVARHRRGALPRPDGTGPRGGAPGDGPAWIRGLGDPPRARVAEVLSAIPPQPAVAVHQAVATVRAERHPVERSLPPGENLIGDGYRGGTGPRPGQDGEGHHVPASGER